MVVIDDFRAENWSLPDLLNLLDRVPVSVEIKGGEMKFNSSTIYITCPYAPETLFFDENWKQFVRRLDTITHVVEEEPAFRNKKTRRLTETRTRGVIKAISEK